jgi:hypothetical protein
MSALCDGLLALPYFDTETDRLYWCSATDADILAALRIAAGENVALIHFSGGILTTNAMERYLMTDGAVCPLTLLQPLADKGAPKKTTGE